MTGPATVQSASELHQPVCMGHVDPWAGPVTRHLELARQNAALHNTDQHPPDRRGCAVCEGRDPAWEMVMHGDVYFCLLHSPKSHSSSTTNQGDHS